MPIVDYQDINKHIKKIDVNPKVAEQLAVFEQQEDNARRKARWRKEASIEGMRERSGCEPADKTVNIEADYEKRKAVEMLNKAISRLNEKQRMLVRLYYYEDKPFVEIARLLKVSKSAITQQFATLHKTLKKYLSEP